MMVAAGFNHRKLIKKLKTTIFCLFFKLKTRFFYNLNQGTKNIYSPNLA